MLSTERSVMSFGVNVMGGHQVLKTNNQTFSKDILMTKQTTDDIVDVSVESGIRRFLEDHKDIVSSGRWVGPSDEVLAEWERNRQDLEGIGLDDDDEDIIPDDKPLTRGDIPVIMGILMDRLNITRFEFSYEEMLAFKGRVILDQPDSRKTIYMMVRQGK